MNFLFATDILYPASGGGGGGGSAPSAPTGLSATGGNGSVSLDWANTSGASTYTVKRGTASGGPYGTTLTSSITVSNYTDSTAVNGTTYYYVVYAVNSYGTSAASSQASATPSAPAGSVSITNQSVTQHSSELQTATAGYRLNTNGNAEARNILAYSTLETWRLSGATADYSCYVTYTGDAPSGAATSSEIAITSSPVWYITAASGTTKSCTLTVQIRNATTHAVLDTATITLTATRD